MRHVRLGSQGLVVSRQGLGCMGMSEFYGAGDDEESIATIHRALELGVTLLDTADIYGPHTNERLVGRAIAGRRDRGGARDQVRHRARPGQPGRAAASTAGPSTCRRAATPRCSASASTTSTSTTSTASTRPRRSRRRSARWPSSSRRARCATSACRRRRPRRSAARTPCTRSRPCRPSTRCSRAIRRTRSCRRCASSASASSPTARSAAASSPARSGRWTICDEGDFRRGQPALPGREPRRATWRIVEAIEAVAAAKGATPAQLALAWVLAQGEDVVPIPGTKRRRVSRGERRRA